MVRMIFIIWSLDSFLLIYAGNFCIEWFFHAYTLLEEIFGKEVDKYLRLFKSSPEPEDNYTVLVQNLAQTTNELNTVYANLESVVDPDLIDYYIYQAKAVQMRYKFLLHCVKEIEDSYAKNPLWVSISI